jgi:hypothetical protein
VESTKIRSPEKIILSSLWAYARFLYIRDPFSDPYSPLRKVTDGYVGWMFVSDYTGGSVPSLDSVDVLHRS